ncbi:hypothetical protein VY88_31865 [Azospirillum thiophilum]|uniref:Helix-turn-helix domain-containing protein n=1 Tax=Azospirillum thiophilum TaxID=528244 RepID=A0AAC8VZK3_9PROT|nr:helix-turn-helix domain-containing protein [Azospirillum thiophilum]ALG72345.1 hypothetical protein AL072_14580 [Azospirillum thiophilum]KJR61308.1 hypothetical protein VY88_31865 [Azospirillum thiophilum]
MTDHTANPNRWGRIPAWWLDHPDLDADGLAVLAALSTYADEAGICWPSQATLADKLKRSRPTVNRILGRLESLGLVTIEHRRATNGGRLSCRYRLVLTTPQGAATGGAGADIPADSRADSPCPAASQKQPESEQIPDTLHLRTGKARSGESEQVAQDWVPSAEDRQWAQDRFPTVDVDRHAERFVQQCRAHGYRYRDAAAAWRSWLLQDMARAGLQSGNGADRRAAGPAPRHAPRSQSRPAVDAEQRLSAWASVAARLNGQSPAGGTAANTAANPWGAA